MSRRDDTPPMRARIPADVDRPDRILFRMTARQIVICTVAGLLLYGMWTALLPLVPAAVLAAVSIPMAALTLAVATVRRDGVGLDRWLLAAVAHRRSPRRQVPATAEQITPPPPWITTTAGRADKLPLPAPLQLPAKGISGEGVVDLGPHGHTALAAASTVNFTLRSAAEQNGLVGGFAGFLHSLQGPVQIVVRAHRVDLSEYAERVRSGAASLPDQALEDAARDYAGFLHELATERELLHRQVTLAVREKRSAAAAHRAAEAARALAGCEVTAESLDAAAVAAALAEACHPASPPPAGGEPR